VTCANALGSTSLSVESRCGQGGGWHAQRPVKHVGDAFFGRRFLAVHKDRVGMLTFEPDPPLQCFLGRGLSLLRLGAFGLIACCGGIEQRVVRRDGPGWHVAAEHDGLAVWSGQSLRGNGRRGSWSGLVISGLSAACTARGEPRRAVPVVGSELQTYPPRSKR
jgi:hypothetical protein